MTPEARARERREAWRVRLLWLGGGALVVAAVALWGYALQPQPTPGAVVVQVDAPTQLPYPTFPPYPTLRPLPTNTPVPTETPLPTPKVAPTAIPACTYANPGDVCVGPYPTPAATATKTPYPIYPGPDLATPGARYIMPSEAEDTSP